MSISGVALFGLLQPATPPRGGEPAGAPSGAGRSGNAGEGAGGVRAGARATGAAATDPRARQAPPGAPPNERNLTQEQRDQVRELQKTDAEVRQHEQAHKTVGGPFAGSIRLEFTTGPDGRRYAVAGEVPIDTSPVRNNPEATIRKAEIVKRAALAPSDPSPADRAVASQADALKAQAQAELQETQRKEAEAASAARRGDPQSADALATAARQTRAAYGTTAPPPAAGVFSLIA
jgi:SprA-related family